jgi:hypothetical protein
MLPVYRFPVLLSRVLFLLLEEWVDHLDNVLIDTEYQGKEGLIKTLLLAHLQHHQVDTANFHIHFGYIGKRAQVHQVAIDTFRGQRPPDRIIREEELLRLLEK